MIEYLQKLMLGSLMLYSIYYLFLRNEKTFRFNRFYLLLIIPMSLAIPLITVQTSYVEVPIVTPQTYVETPQEVVFAIPMESYTTEEEPVISKLNWNQILLYSYFSICILLLLRFTLNLYRLNNFKKQGHLVQKKNYQLCLRDDLKSSFTFLNTIYTNKPKYLANLLPSTILEHEKAHVLQKHSYDIILMELLNTALWFNPVIYLIKHSIKLNHEFLADEAVYQSSTSLPDYQKTLINYTKLNSNNEPLLASRLTFGETKKRLKMMVKNTHKGRMLLKQVLSLSLIIIITFALGAERIVAHEVINNQSNFDPKTKIRFTTSEHGTIEKTYGELTESEKKLLTNRKSNTQIFIPPPPLKEVTNQMLIDFRNLEKYGVWIDNERVENDQLDQYKPSEYHHYYTFKLPQNSEDYGQYAYHVRLFTKKYFNSLPNSGGQWVPFNTEFMPRVHEKLYRQTGIENRTKSSQTSIHKDSTLLGQKVIPLVSLSPDTKVRYNSENGKTVESEFGKLSHEQRTIFASPEAKGEVRFNSSFDSKMKWRSYMELLNWAKRSKQNKIPNFFRGENGIQSMQDTLPKKSNFFAPSPNRMVRFISTKGDTVKKLYKNLSESEIERFRQNEASPAYFAPPPPRGIVPDNFAEQFSDEREYGVWLDGKRIRNSELKKYSADQIHHYWKSVLHRKAKNYGVHTFQLNMYTNKYFEERLNNGTWINLLTIPEGGIEEFKEQKKSGNESGNRPFPSYVFHDNTKTRWVDEKGHIVKSTEKTGTEDFQFYVPPVKASSVSEETLQEYISSHNYYLWLNNEPVLDKSDLEISADRIHHTQDIFSNGIHKLNIITKDYSKIQEIENGFWVTVPKESANKLDSKRADLKEGENDIPYSPNPQSQMPFIGFDTTKVEHFRVPTPSTHVKFIDTNKRLVVQEWKNLTDAQKMQWFTKDQEGMIFSPPSAKTKIDFIVLNEIIEDNESEIILNGQKVEASSLNGIYPFEIHDFSRTEDKDGKTTYNLTTNEVFLAEEYLETHWISNVIYKKADK